MSHQANTTAEESLPRQENANTGRKRGMAGGLPKRIARGKQAVFSRPLTESYGLFHWRFLDSTITVHAANGERRKKTRSVENCIIMG
jgi:hypothetical protein